MATIGHRQGSARREPRHRGRSAITEEATLDSLGIDSLDMVELICDLEEKCDVEFGEPEGIATMGQLVAHIDSLQQR